MIAKGITYHNIYKDQFDLLFMGLAGNISPQRLQKILRDGPPKGAPPTSTATLWDLAILESPRRVRSNTIHQDKHPLIVNPEISGGYAVGQTSRSHIGLRVGGTKPELWYFNLNSGLSVTVLLEDRAISVSVLSQNNPETEERLGMAFTHDHLLTDLAKTYSKINILKNKGVPPGEMEILLGAELSLYEPRFYELTRA